MRRICALAALAATVLALTLRLPGVPFGFPLLVHPDEHSIVDPALRMLKDGDPNPHWFEYPSLTMYLNSGLYAAGAKLTGANSAAEIDPIRIQTWSRTMTVIIAAATVAVVYAAAALAFGPIAGAGAAFFLAVSRLHVTNSYMVTTDAPATLALALVLWASLAIVARGPSLRRYLLAGAAVGLAAGCKYPAVYGAASVIAAHLVTNGLSPKALWRSGALAAAAMAAVVFLATTPYAVLDFPTFRATLAWQSQHFSSGHIGAEALGTNSYALYASWLRSLVGGPGGLLVLVGLATALWTKPREAVVLAAFPVLYLLVMGSYRVAFERYLVVILPAVAIAAGASALLVPRIPKRAAALGAIALAVWWGVSITGQARASRAQVAFETQPDTRVLAEVWIREHLPANSRIAREQYTPTLRDAGFRIRDLGYFGMIQQTGLGRFHFLIASSGDYGRFVNHVEQYPREAKAYERVFGMFEEIHRVERDFSHNGPTIRVFATEKGKRRLRAHSKPHEGAWATVPSPR